MLENYLVSANFTRQSLYEKLNQNLKENLRGWCELPRIFLSEIAVRKIGHYASCIRDEVTENRAVSAELGQVAITLTDTRANLSQSLGGERYTLLEECAFAASVYEPQIRHYIMQILALNHWISHSEITSLLIFFLCNTKPKNPSYWKLQARPNSLAFLAIIRVCNGLKIVYL